MIISIDGWTDRGFDDMQRIVSVNGGRELAFEVDRGGEKLTLKVTPERARAVGPLRRQVPASA